MRKELSEMTMEELWELFRVFLTVVSSNDRAYRLYDSLGFKECGRIPKANKYQDGSYADDIHMVKRL